MSDIYTMQYRPYSRPRGHRYGVVNCNSKSRWWGGICKTKNEAFESLYQKIKGHLYKEDLIELRRKEDKNWKDFRY